MTAEDFRSIVRGPWVAMACGLAGAMTFGAMAKRWARWVPSNCGKKDRARLLDEQKSVLRTAKIMSAAGLLVGLFSYHWLDDHDWRGLGLGLGLMAVSPIVAVIAGNLSEGSKGIREGFMAYTMSEKTPPKILISVLGFLLLAGVASAISLFR